MAHTLPYIEAANVRDLMDFTVDIHDILTGSSDVPEDVKDSLPTDVQLPVARCPSDTEEESFGQGSASDHAPANYVVCYGTGETERPDGSIDYGSAYPMLPPDGAFYINSHTKLKRITDGTSNTVAVSECRIGKPFIRDNRDFLSCTPESEFLMLKDRGASWLYAVRNQFWGFSTQLLPNDTTVEVECMRHSGRGVFAARSYHPGGVNVSMLDGSVRFVNDSVDPLAWFAMGSIAGGEAASIDSL